MDRGFLTVSQVNGYIKSMFASDDVMNGISVCGEISNVKYHSSGHVYLTLKDEDSTLSAVMFRTDAARLTFRPENGMRVIASGRIGVYERGGQYQLYIGYMKPDGLGQLYMSLEALKKKLEAEGLFDRERKKKLPLYPKRIGVVTSPTGAVIRDIIRVTGRRYGLCDIVLFPVHVQGDEAVGEICAGIQYFNEEKNVDLLIVGRGGGSIEDLWAFNSEAVVRAIADSRLPVISAVGHQSDFTLSDLAADCTAGTPSMAGELAVPDIKDIYEKISSSEQMLTARMQKRIDDARLYLDQRWSSLEQGSPKNRLRTSALELDVMRHKLNTLMGERTERSQRELAQMSAKLSALSPLAVLSRGYGLVCDREGQAICQTAQLKVGDKVRIIMADGSVGADITNVEPGDIQ